MTDARSIISETSITDHPIGNINIFDDTDELELQQRVEHLE